MILFPSSFDSFSIVSQPIALQALQPSSPIIRIKIETRRYEVGNLLCILGRKVILLVQDFIYGPEFELFNVLQVALLVEEILPNASFFGIFPKSSWNMAK